jgi:hypothetical protein
MYRPLACSSNHGKQPLTLHEMTATNGWVQDPNVFGVGTSLTRFLGKEPMVGIESPDLGENDLFHLEIALGDDIAESLLANHSRPARQPSGRFGGVLDNLPGGFEKQIDRHCGSRLAVIKRLPRGATPSFPSRGLG